VWPALVSRMPPARPHARERALVDERVLSRRVLSRAGVPVARGGDVARLSTRSSIVMRAHLWCNHLQRPHHRTRTAATASNVRVPGTVGCGLHEEVLPHVRTVRLVKVGHATVLARAAFGEDVLANVHVRLEANRARKEDLVGHALDHGEEACPSPEACEEDRASLGNAACEMHGDQVCAGQRLAAVRSPWPRLSDDTSSTSAACRSAGGGESAGQPAATAAVGTSEAGRHCSS
jgi:hypothetical protein